jgi:magnesium chelatase accessory protein
MDRLDWKKDGHDWPNGHASRFVPAGGISWHVQTMGSGPSLLLLHGTGSSTHSWARLMPLLAEHFTVIAPDLPGHAFTQTPTREGLTLPGMAQLVGALLATLDAHPAIAVGHSAGAAILARMCLDRIIRPRALVSINGALLPMGGLAGSIFSPLAKALVLNPLAPRLFAWRAKSKDSVRRVLEGTGSPVDARDLALYARLFRNVPHVSGTLAMMAGWDLEPLRRDLARLDVPLVLLSASADRAIPPADADLVKARVPGASLRRLDGLGHLAHEECPGLIGDVVLEVARAHGILR